MQVLTQTDVLQSTWYANPNFVNYSGVIKVGLTKETQVKVDGVWQQIPDAKVEMWRMFVIDNSLLVDASGVKTTALDGEGNPQFNMGAYDYVLSLTAGQIGMESDSYIWAVIAGRLEQFILDNFTLTED